MSAVHDFRKNKHNAVRPDSDVTREYNAKEFNDYLNKYVCVLRAVAFISISKYNGRYTYFTFIL